MNFVLIGATILSTASAQELLPAFVVAGRGDLLPPRADATTAEALRAAVLSRRPALALFVTTPSSSAAAVARAAAGGGAPALATLLAARPSVEIAFARAPAALAAAPVALDATAEALAALDAAALARGVAPVVVDAAAPSLGELDAALPGLVAAAERAAGGAFVVVVTGEAGARAAPARRLAPRRRLADAPAAPAGVRLTPDGALGLLVGLAFVAVSLLGLTCIGAIQTPSRFATAHPPSTKEF